MAFKSPLEQMSKTTPTQFWNDSCSIPELQYALEHGAVGATTNPVIVGQVLEGELPAYIPVIKKFIADHPYGTEDEIAWLLNEKMAVEGAKLLLPVYQGTAAKAGYISIQTNAKYYRNPVKMAEQAVHFSSLAPNIMVKMPATAEGVKAVEACTYQGVNINATVSFSVSQALAVAQAVERALAKRKAEGLDNSKLHPICTIMVGRVDDWMKEAANDSDAVVDPMALELAGVAVFKNAYRIYKEKGYQTRLLAAAYRSHYHWTELVGGDVSLTIPHRWIRRFAQSDIKLENKMDTPVNAVLLDQLRRHIPDFNRAYEADGMTAAEFAGYGASRRTLMQFLNGYDKMVQVIRKQMVEI